MTTHTHVGFGYCQVCKHFGEDCTGKKPRQTAAKRLEAELLLSRVAELQHEFWDMSFELEKMLGCEVDTNLDLSGYTVADLKRMRK